MLEDVLKMCMIISYGQNLLFLRMLQVFERRHRVILFCNAVKHVCVKLPVQIMVSRLWMASNGITEGLQLDCVDRPSPLVLPWFLRHTVANIFIITIEVSFVESLYLASFIISSSCCL